MLGLEDEIERIIAACIDRHSKGDPAALARTILQELWEAGYDVTRRPDMIPILRNPGEDTASSPYTAEKEREDQGLAGLTPAELFRQLADESRNASIRYKIGEIARAFRKA